jgi:hypothetical protein
MKIARQLYRSAKRRPDLNTHIQGFSRRLFTRMDRSNRLYVRALRAGKPVAYPTWQLLEGTFDTLIQKVNMDSLIANEPPNDGREWECQCARCGSSLNWVQCGACGGEGITGPGELYEQDPLWYDQDDYESCHQCDGESSWPSCLSGFEWCLLNPSPGRIEIPPSTAEWFALPARPSE